MLNISCLFVGHDKLLDNETFWPVNDYKKSIYYPRWFMEIYYLMSHKQLIEQIRAFEKENKILIKFKWSNKFFITYIILVSF